MKKNDLDKILKIFKKIDLGKHKKSKRIAIDLAMIAIGILWIVLMVNIFTNETKTYNAEFVKCIDGDTIKVAVNYKVESVRLLAIDTPEVGSESDYYGLEASEYTCDLITNAKTIKLELDDNAYKYDKYGRMLAWVFVDGDLLQSKLVENGYAKTAYLYGDYTYTEDIKKLEKIAKSKKIGMWGID